MQKNKKVGSLVQHSEDGCFFLSAGAGRICQHMPLMWLVLKKKKSGIEKLGGYKAWSSGFLAQLSPVHVSVCHFASLSPEKCQNVALKIVNKSHLLKPCLQLRLLL